MDKLEVNLRNLTKSDDEILRFRAEILSQPFVKESAEEKIELLRFQLAYQQCAIETQYVKEVVYLRQIIPLPFVPKFVLGMMNHRGEVMSVLDITKYFDPDATPLSDLNRVIIITNGAMSFGIAVDRIHYIDFISRAEIQNGANNKSVIPNDLLLGFLEGSIYVLNAKCLLADKNIIVRSTTY
jgi:purine-binding chemotaxis protein CheW